MLKYCTIVASCLLLFLAISLIIIELLPGSTQPLPNQDTKRATYCAMLLNIAWICIIIIIIYLRPRRDEIIIALVIE
ncbi:hypothetical protein PENTCL1PPCAC_20433 [Pristionchus entomophagus]|uniref:Uncharacterized protein n=1 Tax=Pristionchus entomophagus TaxID=358040 RepID=A0AAV5TVK5_9BILA|nr:hypothetical protein PENTCL1PPCAC_20433 [Pristionchus entomophagus]